MTPEMTITDTPTGEAGLHITCTDPAHWHCGKSAIIRKPSGTPRTDTVCGLIDLAHHPVLAKAPTVKRSGPWAA